MKEELFLLIKKEKERERGNFDKKLTYEKN